MAKYAMIDQKYCNPTITLPVPPKLSYASVGDPLAKRLLIGVLEHATGRRKLEQLYAEIQAMDLRTSLIWKVALLKLEIGIDYNATQLAHIPNTGPLIFVANHPFGVVDGLILGYFVSRVRSRFTVLASEVLYKERLFSSYILPIDLSDFASQAVVFENHRYVFPSGVRLPNITILERHSVQLILILQEVPMFFQETLRDDLPLCDLCRARFAAWQYRYVKNGTKKATGFLCQLCLQKHREPRERSKRDVQYIPLPLLAHEKMNCCA